MDSYLFDLTPQLLHDALLSMIAVFTLFLVASHFLFNPIRDMLKKRKEQIRGDLDDAKISREEAQRLKEEYEAKLQNVEKEAEEILSAARKKALANEAKIIADAKEEAVRIRERAAQEAELEKKKAADDVVAASMNTAIQDSLLEDTLKEIGDTTWLS